MQLKPSLNSFSTPAWSMFSKCLIVIFGGYVFANIMAVFIGQLLVFVMTKPQAIHTGLLLSFLVYAGIAMWAFHNRSAKQVWLSIIALNGIFAGLSWVLLQVNNS